MTPYPVKPKQPAAAAEPVVSAAAGDDLVVGAPTLKQTGVCEDKLTPTGVNQLERAAVTFGDVGALHKHWCATVGLSATATWHSEQSKTLRNPDSIRKWELAAIKGKCDDHVRTTISQLKVTTHYAKCGIETHWPSLTISSADPRVAYADDRSRLLWRMLFSCGREWEHRNMA